MLVLLIHLSLPCLAQTESTLTNEDQSTSSYTKFPIRYLQKHFTIQNPSNAPTNSVNTCKEIELSITFDGNPEDISWVILNSNEQLVAKADGYHQYAKQKVIAMKHCLIPDTYTFIIKDRKENGLCCRESRGSYHLRVADGMSLASGASFGSRETTVFTVHDPALRTTDVTVDKVQTTELVPMGSESTATNVRTVSKIASQEPAMKRNTKSIVQKTIVSKELLRKTSTVHLDSLKTGKYLVKN